MNNQAMELEKSGIQANQYTTNSEIPKSTNNDKGELSDKLRHLSLATAAATALPVSSPVSSPIKKRRSDASTPVPTPQQPQQTPIRRIPSSSSYTNSDRSRTPILQKRASLSSLHGAGDSTSPRSPAFRRTSSHAPSSSSPGSGAKPELLAPLEEPPAPVMTAATFAQEYFKTELQAHNEGSDQVHACNTVVILQDHCYGHRYARPRTSRAGLSSIVERPERIHASVLGLSTAYVRLGGRHAEGHCAPQVKTSTRAPLPFRIQKTRRALPLTSQAVTNIHGLKWMNELKAMCDAAETKLALNGKELTRPPSQEQANGNTKSEKPKLHEGDLYLCSGSLEALEGALGGLCEGVDAVFDDSNAKRAFVCIRPPGHHCSADYPSGFCWLNNVHVGIGHAALTHGLTHAAIIDFDLHHGDGSQSIAWAHNSKIASLPKNAPLSKKAAIGYFSLHDINSYPCEMGDEEKVMNASLCMENAHGQTIWNVHLQPWKTEADFWRLYEDRYLVLLSKARAFLRSHTDRLLQNPLHPEPKAAIFLSAGFDASEWESPGMQRHQVNVPTDFYARFTRDVVRLADEEGLGVDGRVISVLEGGYSDRALMSGVLSHLSGLTSVDSSTPLSPMSNGLGRDMARRLGSLNLTSEMDRGAQQSRDQRIETYDPEWWALARLEELENLVNPPAPAAAPKKQRSAVAPTYSSTTQSFSAKIVSPPAGRRSLSGSGGYFTSAQTTPRLPEQPLPPINWATAAHELSKLLIPSDRQTQSCKPEELNAEASRARKARHSAIGLPAEMPAPSAPPVASVTNGKRMQLRERTSKAPKYASEDEEERPVSKANRRRTIADPALLAQDPEKVPTKTVRTTPKKPSQPRNRRLSAASSVGTLNDDNPAENNGGSVDSELRKDPLLVKKTRAVNETRTDASKTKPVKKAPPVPRYPSGLSNASTAVTPIPESDQVASVASNEAKDKEVDTLTSSMTKMSIKLNLPPKEVQEAKEAKLKPAARGRPKTATTKTAKTSIANKAATVAPAIESEPRIADTTMTDLPSQATGEQIPESPATETQQFTTTPTLPAQTTNSPPANPSSHSPLDDSAQDPPKEQIEQPTALTAPVSQPVSFVAPTTPSIPAQVPPIAPTASPELELASNPTPLPEAAPQQEDDPTSPPSNPAQPRIQAPTAPPPSTPKHPRHALPVFTATSPIYFSENSTATTRNINHEPTPSAQLLVSRPENEHPPPASSPSSKHEQKAAAADASIWDIPETPQQPRRK